MLMRGFESYFSFIKREGRENLLNYLQSTDYFKAPASGGYHLAKEGGLLEHILNVAEVMFDVANILPGEEISEESIAIVALFHDLGKATYFGKPNYVENILKSGKRSDAKPYETNKERLNIPHEIASIHILAQYIKLTEEETFAIMYHNGLYTPLGYGVKGNETKLYLLLHFADMFASRFVEI